MGVSMHLCFTNSHVSAVSAENGYDTVSQMTLLWLPRTLNLMIETFNKFREITIAEGKKVQLGRGKWSVGSLGSSLTLRLFYHSGQPTGVGSMWGWGWGGFIGSVYLASSLMRLAMRRLSSTHRSFSDTCPRFPPPAGRILRSSRLWDSCYKNTHSFCDRVQDRFWDSCYKNTHSFCDRVQDRFWDSCCQKHVAFVTVHDRLWDICCQKHAASVT